MYVPLLSSIRQTSSLATHTCTCGGSNSDSLGYTLKLNCPSVAIVGTRRSPHQCRRQSQCIKSDTSVKVAPTGNWGPLEERAWLRSARRVGDRIVTWLAFRSIRDA